MRSKDPNYRRPLSTKQVELLKLVYIFRFVTTDLIAEYLHKDRSTIYESFSVLEKQNYVFKFYDSTFRLRQRPAIYTLHTKGIKYFSDSTKFPPATLRNFYRNRVAREDFIDHTLTVFRYYLNMRAHTKNTHDIYTKYELLDDSVIKPKPELYLNPMKKNEKHYLVDIFPPGTLTWLLTKRLRQHQGYADEYDDALYPDVLLIAPNDSTEKRLFRLLESSMQEFNFYITNEELLRTSRDGKIWIDIDHSDEEEFVRVKLSGGNTR